MYYIKSKEGYVHVDIFGRVVLTTKEKASKFKMAEAASPIAKKIGGSYRIVNED